MKNPFEKAEEIFAERDRLSEEEKRIIETIAFAATKNLQSGTMSAPEAFFFAALTGFCMAKAKLGDT